MSTIEGFSQDATSYIYLNQGHYDTFIKNNTSYPYPVWYFRCNSETTVIINEPIDLKGLKK